MKPTDFIAAIAPAARESMQITGVPASVVIAQGALESAWGESLLAKLGMNLFGVKADKAWHGNTLSMPTTEYIGGKAVRVNALWRKYASWRECIEDHGEFLLDNPRYRKAFGFRDGELFARAIADAGYATDPKYFDKLTAVMRVRNLKQFDSWE